MTLEQCLEGVDRCRPFFVALLGERYGRPVGTIPTALSARFSHLRFLGGCSRMAIEIIHGVLNDPARADASVFFFRRPAFLDQIPEERRSEFTTEGHDAQQVADLKQAIRESNRPVIEYDCKWDAENGTISGLAGFFRAAFQSLRRHILRQCAGSLDPLAFIEACDEVEHELARQVETQQVVKLPREETVEVVEPQTPSAADNGTAPYLDENVQFTVYRPRVVRPEEWYSLLAFAHLSERPFDAPQDEPDPIEEVRRRAGLVLGARARDYQDTTRDSRHAVPREGEITFLPDVPGLEFNPPSRSFLWKESVHQEEFRLRANQALAGQTVTGRFTVFLGSIILADMRLSIHVDPRHQTARADDRLKVDHARPYHKIFASYSHQDLAIVRQFEWYARALGDEYLRDWVHLRAGEVWSESLLRLIDKADVFQLFWSSRAMSSPFVKQEWEYALSLGRPNFVRPTYWEDPLPQSAQDGLPPETLLRLHFQRIPLVLPGASAGSSEPLSTSDIVALQPDSNGDFEPSARKEGKEIFDDADFAAPFLRSDRDGETMQPEAASAFDLEKSDSGSEVFAIDEEDVDQNAASAVGAGLDVEEEAEDLDEFAGATSDEMAADGAWDIGEGDSTTSGSMAARSTPAKVLSAARPAEPSFTFKVVAITIAVASILGMTLLLIYLLRH